MLKSTHRPPPNPGKNEEEARCEHEEDQDDGEQVAAEDKGSPSRRVERVNVVVERHAGSTWDQTGLGRRAGSRKGGLSIRT